MRQRLKQSDIRLFALIVAAMLLLTCVPTAHAAETAGTCGVGVTWSLEGGVLTLSGSGVMNDYGEFAPAPWNDHAESIRAVVVEQGVENVGNFAFFMLDKLTSVTLPDSVRKIGSWAFYGCEALRLLDLGKGVQEIDRSAFERCYALTGVRLPASLQTLRYHAFYRCEGLTSITVPSGVTVMEASVFAYCIGLRSAKVLANLTELPRWTFYGCESLVSVSLTPAITQVGADAYYDCDLLEAPKHDAAEGNVSESNSNTVQTEDGSVTTQNNYTQTDNSIISGQIVTTENADGKNTQVQIDAVLENNAGWQELEQKVEQLPGKTQQVQVDVHLKGDSVVSGEDIGRFSQQDVNLSIHTTQGAVWHIQTGNLKDADLAEEYDLSFVLRPLTNLTEAQQAAVGNAKSYGVKFNRTLDFKVEVELPLGRTLSYRRAVFFAPEKKGFTRMQTVMIDTQGVAHFYLGHVEKDVEYVIGIDVPAKEGDSAGAGDVIIPDSMKGEYPNLVQTADIDYIITGRKSSWGMNIGQVTWILVGVLGGCVIVVGGVMFTMNKRRLKAGYIPQTDHEEE